MTSSSRRGGRRIHGRRAIPPLRDEGVAFGVLELRPVGAPRHAGIIGPRRSFFLTRMIYLSSLAFPIENMPGWIQWETYLIPLRYFLLNVRGIFLKGVGIAWLWPQIAALLACGLVLIALATLRSSKRLA